MTKEQAERGNEILKRIEKLQRDEDLLFDVKKGKALNLVIVNTDGRKISFGDKYLHEIMVDDALDVIHKEVENLSKELEVL